MHQEGYPLDRCVGFIDCTKIKMCRPGGHPSFQYAVYSGHKRIPSLIYRSTSTPKGIMFTLLGPDAGNRLDLTLYYNIGWGEILENALFINGIQYYIYGDKRYVLRPWMRPQFRMIQFNPIEERYNKFMLLVCVLVEKTTEM